MRYMSEPRLQPAALPIGTWWWDGKLNFGDRLTDLLLPNYGIAPFHASRKRARLYGVGSIIDASLPDFDGYFWRTGKYIASDTSTRPNATFLAVRGALTRDLLGLAPDTPLGDPGILISKHVAPLPKHGKIAVVPHFTHRGSGSVERLLTRLGSSGELIDVQRPTVQVVRDISRCSAVISTSLHGLITADAYGIPALWSMEEPMLTGGDFKFRDYESVVLPNRDRCVAFDDIRDESDLVQRAGGVSQLAVTQSQKDLESALQRLLVVEDRRTPPIMLPLHLARGIAYQW